MDYEALQYTIAAIYTSLVEATELATGKPIEQLSSYLLRGFADANAPVQARELLARLAAQKRPGRRQRRKLRNRTA